MRISRRFVMTVSFLIMVLCPLMVAGVSSGACPLPGRPSKPSPSSGARGVSTSPTLSWTATNSDSYDVYFGTTSNPPLVGTTNSTSYSPSSLSYNKVYYWRIVAKNSCNKSTRGFMWYFRTTPTSPDTAAPSVPAGLTAAAISCSEINLSWSASTDTGGSGLKGYNLYRNGSFLKQMLAPSTSASDPGLVASTLYSYAVSAIDNAGNESAKSSATSATTPACPDITAPSVPAGLTATTASCSQINLSWGASTDTGGSGLKGYSVYRNGSFLKQVLSPLTSTSDTGLAASTTYSYTVSAIDNAGNESAKSNTAATNTPACPDNTPPTVPGGLNTTAISSSQINLSWNPSTDTGGSGLAGYKVYRGSSQVGTAASTAYSDSGLAASTQYCYTVAAYDGAGNTSAPATQVCETTQNSSSGGETVWAKKFGGSQNDVGRSVAVDNEGNIITVGNFFGTLDLGGGPITSGTETSNMYIAKYSSSGAYLWAKHYSSHGRGSEEGINPPTPEITPLAIAVDSSNNVLITGRFVGTVDLGGGPRTSAYRSDVFVAKYSSSGAYLWSKTYADGGQSSGNSIAVDSADNVVVAGEFTGYVDFGDSPNYTGPTFIRTYGRPSIFLVKLSPSGTFLWGKSPWPGNYDSAYGVAVDKNDSILMTGYFTGTLDFGGGPLGDGLKSFLFLAKYSSSGTYLWARNFGGTGGNYGYSVAVDDNNNVFVTGGFMGTVDFGGEQLTADSAARAVFVAKYSTSGSLLWARQAGGSATGRGIVVDGSGNATVTGCFYSPADFGGGSIAGGGDLDIFVAKYSASGTHLWSRGFGGLSSDWGWGIAADGSGNTIVTGSFGGTVDFGGTVLTSTGYTGGVVSWWDIFLLKLAP